MKIQPITTNMVRNNRKVNVLRETPTQGTSIQTEQPNFKGLKGASIGGALGAGLTALGVTAIAGVAALPAFLGYIVVNGAISAGAGHLAQEDSNNKKD